LIGSAAVAQSYAKTDNRDFRNDNERYDFKRDRDEDRDRDRYHDNKRDKHYGKNMAKRRKPVPLQAASVRPLDAVKPISKLYIHI